jgi:hypothetical protein
MCGWKAACAPCPPGRRRRRPPSSCARRAWPQPRAAASPFAGFVSQLAQNATGSALQPGAVVPRGVPELQVNTTLQGMALDLPAPLGKTAEPSSPCAMNKWWRANPWCPLPPRPRRRRCATRSRWAWAARVGHLPARFGRRPAPGAARGSMGVACRPVNLRRWWPGRGRQHPAGPGGRGCVGASVDPVHQRTRQCCRWGCWRCTPRRHRRDGPGPAPSPAMDYLPNVVALRATELSAQGRTCTTWWPWAARRQPVACQPGRL